MLPLTAIAFAAPAVAPMTELPVFHRIEASDLTLVEVPEALVHPNAITRIEDAIGRIALEPLLPGEVLRAERLGTDARSTLMGPNEDLVLLPLKHPEQWAPGRVDLVAITPGGACLIAEDVRSHGTAEPGLMALAAAALQAHQLRWAIHEVNVVPLARNPIDRSREPTLTCSGELPVSSVALTSGSGTLLRLTEPFTNVVVSHTNRVTADAVTPTDLWVHGIQPGRTAASITLKSGPPILVDLLVAQAQPPSATLYSGGLGTIDLPGVIEAKAWPADAAKVSLATGLVRIEPHHEGLVEVWTRTEAGDMDLHPFVVTSQWPAPKRGETVLPLAPNKRRKIAMPAPVVGAWSGSSSIASVEIKGTKARITAHSPGTTEILVMDSTGQTSKVRLVVLGGPQ